MNIKNNKVWNKERMTIRMIIFVCIVVASLIPDIGIKFSTGSFVWTFYRITSFLSLVIVVFFIDKKVIIDRKSESQKWVLFMLAWLIYGVVLLVLSPYADMHAGIIELLSIFNGTIIIYISSTIKVNSDRINLIINIISVIAIMLVFLGIIEILTGWHISTSVVIQDKERSEAFLNVATGLMFNPNDFSAFITALFPICMLNKYVRWPYLAGVIVINIVNEANTCNLAIIIMFIYWMSCFQSRNRKRKISYFGIAALAVIMLYIMGIMLGFNLPGATVLFTKISWAMDSVSRVGGSLFGRIGIYKELITVCIKSCGLGIGPAGIPIYFKTFPSITGLVNPHAFLLEILTQYGIIIFSWFVIRVAGIIRKAHFLADDNKKLRRYYIAASGTMIVYLIVSFAPSSFIGYSYQWLIIAIACTMLRLGDSEEGIHE